MKTPENISRPLESAVVKAWKKLNPILRGAHDFESFRMGWEAAMRSIWDRLPMTEFRNDPMTPREVGRLLDFVKSNMPAFIEGYQERVCPKCFTRAFADRCGVCADQTPMAIEIPCPDCYGGHFRPCQVCGDSGIALKVPQQPSKLQSEIAALKDIPGVCPEAKALLDAAIQCLGPSTESSLRNNHHGL